MLSIDKKFLKDIRLFTSQPIAKFYDSLFLNLDLSFVPEFLKIKRKGFQTVFAVFLFMTTESQIPIECFAPLYFYTMTILFRYKDSPLNFYLF